MNRIHIAIIAWMALLLGGCTASKALFAMAKSTDDFRTLRQDPRVKYEPGAEAMAKAVATNLDHAIKLIEARQYAAFAKPVMVYVPNTVKSFAAYCIHVSAGGCVLNERLFISPKKANTPQRIPRILAHELSHLHMEQRLGMWHWHSNTTEWFREGLAVYVSDGGGAEDVSMEQAQHAIAAGNTFTPATTGSLLKSKTARDYSLKPHMFYRQAGVFVAWLHAQGVRQFKSLLHTIQAGSTLDKAMHKAYGAGVLQEWKVFVNDIKKHTDTARRIHSAQAIA